MLHYLPRSLCHVITITTITIMLIMPALPFYDMQPARRLYESVGYSLRIETEVPLREVLGEGEWDVTKVAHYLKSL